MQDKEAIGPNDVLEVDYIEVDMPKPARASCAGCDDARATLDRAIAQVEPVLRELGSRIEVRELKVRTGAEAELLRLRASPTIRVGGLDLRPEHRGDDGEERIWLWRGREYRVPPPGLFTEALMMASTSSVESGAYQVPAYLRRFLGEPGV